MNAASRDKLLQSVINLFVAGAVALPILIFFLNGVPYKRGFFCNDETINHPYKSSTVPTSVLFGLGLGLPILLILVVEVVVCSLAKRGAGVLERIVNFLHLTVGFCFGAAGSQCLVDIAKYSIGRLRPHFLDVCRPDYSLIDCGSAIKPRYVTEFECLGNPELIAQGEQESRLEDAMVSFMSGHASFSFQMSTFIILYLQARFLHRSERRATLLIPLVQFVAFVMAYFTSLSRISDYKHHAGDVLAGAILGITVQVINVTCHMKLFSDNDLPRVDDIGIPGIGGNEVEASQKRLSQNVSTEEDNTSVRLNSAFQADP